MIKQGFDNDKYLAMQSDHIRERISKFGDKLYLEFGGKLYDDYHASRVLPGFDRTASSACSCSWLTRQRSSSSSMPLISQRTRSATIWALHTIWMYCA